MAELVMDKPRIAYRDVLIAKSVADKLGDGPVFAGSIFGRVTGTVQRTNLNGDTVDGLKGDFEAHRATPLQTKEGAVSVLRSGVLFMSAKDHDALVASHALVAAPVEFSGHLTVVKGSDGRPAYAFSYVVSPRLADPLAKVREQHENTVVADPAPPARRGGKGE